MLPTAGSTPRSVFPTAMAAATVPGTPRTERAAAPRRICPKPTARAFFTASQLTNQDGQHTHDQAARLRCPRVYRDADILPAAGAASRADNSVQYPGRHA